jgi:integrator complex subunit 2
MAGKFRLQAQINELVLTPSLWPRSWISFFVRNGQKRRCPALAALRTELARRVAGVLAAAAAPALPAGAVREASALVRLYTALRGVAGMKFTEEEVRVARIGHSPVAKSSLVS